MKAAGLKVTRAAIDKAIANGAGAVTARLAELATQARAPGLDANDHPEPPTLVLSIDQGEELFQAEGRDEAKALLVLLASDDNTARIWNVYQTQELVDAARAKLTRCLTPAEREELYLPPEPRYEADPLYCLR